MSGGFNFRGKDDASSLGPYRDQRFKVSSYLHHFYIFNMVNSFAKFLLFSFLHKDMFDWIVIQEGMENVKLFFLEKLRHTLHGGFGMSQNRKIYTLWMEDFFDKKVLHNFRDSSKPD